MTRKQFEQVRFSIQNERFQPSTSDPLTFGIERANFDCQKYKRLISASKGLSFSTVTSKRATWLRQLERATATVERLEKLRADIEAVRPKLISSLRDGNLSSIRA